MLAALWAMIVAFLFVSTFLEALGFVLVAAFVLLFVAFHLVVFTAVIVVSIFQKRKEFARDLGIVLLASLCLLSIVLGLWSTGWSNWLAWTLGIAVLLFCLWKVIDFCWPSIEAFYAKSWSERLGLSALRKTKQRIPRPSDFENKEELDFNYDNAFEGELNINARGNDSPRRISAEWVVLSRNRKSSVSTINDF